MEHSIEAHKYRKKVARKCFHNYWKHRFFNFKFESNTRIDWLLDMKPKDCRTTIPLSSLKILYLYVINDTL